eukprot:3794867-Prorocentrum_lima.AAC.1
MRTSCANTDMPLTICACASDLAGYPQLMIAFWSSTVEEQRCVSRRCWPSLRDRGIYDPGYVLGRRHRLGPEWALRSDRRHRPSPP